jgi:hypothetical protein
MVFTGVVSCLDLNAFAMHKSAAIHLLSEDRSFLAQIFVKGRENDSVFTIMPRA